MPAVQNSANIAVKLPHAINPLHNFTSYFTAKSTKDIGITYLLALDPFWLLPHKPPFEVISLEFTLCLLGHKNAKHLLGFLSDHSWRHVEVVFKAIPPLCTAHLGVWDTGNEDILMQRKMFTQILPASSGDLSTTNQHAVPEAFPCFLILFHCTWMICESQHGVAFFPESVESHKSPTIRFTFNLSEFCFHPNRWPVIRIKPTSGSQPSQVKSTLRPVCQTYIGYVSSN